MLHILRLVALAGFFFSVFSPPIGCPLILAAESSVAIDIEGLEGASRENVTAILRIPPGIETDGAVNLPLLKRFEEDVPDKVQQALEPFGYYESRVQTELQKIGENRYRLTVRVTPGEPVLVGSVRLEIEGPGKEETALRRTIRRFPLGSGDILLHETYEKAKGDIQTRAVTLGYLDADFATHLITVNLDTHKADIELTLTTGERYFFDGIDFSGTKSYPDRFLRRYLAFKPGDPFSYPKLGETQANLRNSDRFSDVVVRADRRAAVDHRVPVRITLTDAPSKRLRLGAGYETDTGPRFSLLYQDLNVLDQGHEFDTELNLAQRIQGIAARYILPSATDHLSRTSFKLTVQREDVPAYTTNLGMFEITRERSLGEGRTGGLFLRFLYEDSDVGNERNSSYLTLPGVRYAIQRYNSLIRPARGFRFSGEVRGTTRLFGSDQTFVQVVSDGDYVRKISRHFLVRARGQAGLTLQKESIDDLPATLRFFAGGDRSVRGYRYQSLGPEDQDGEVTGGKNVLTGSLELEREIGEHMGIVGFYDVGNAFNDLARLRLFQGVGLGVRYYTPVGPIKLDVAHPLDRSSPLIRIHLSFGIGT